MNVIKKISLIVFGVAAICGAAGEGWIVVKPENIMEMGKLVGVTLGARGSGQMNLRLKGLESWPFAASSLSSQYPNQIAGEYWVTGKMNEEDANKQVLAILLGANASGKSLRIYISEDDGTSQYAGRAYIRAAFILN